MIMITTINGKRLRQTADSSCEFLETILNDENNRKVIVFNRSKKQLKIRKGKFGHVVQIHVCRKRDRTVCCL